jgi:hypothetical protein
MLKYPDNNFTLDAKSQENMKLIKKVCAWLASFLVLTSFVFLFLAEDYDYGELRIIYGYLFLIIFASTIPVCVFLIIKTYNCSTCNNKMVKVKKEFIYEDEPHIHKFQICKVCKSYIYDGLK